jgi:hypothetical protein
MNRSHHNGQARTWGGNPLLTSTTRQTAASDVQEEHEPEHFHAEHQSQQGKFNFSGEMTIGGIRSRTALRLIREWAGLHQAELQENWKQMKAGQPLNGIAPLD